MWGILANKKSGKNRPTKELVFEILSRNSPLTIAQTQHALFDKYRERLSYQAVRKAINALSDDGVLNHGKDGYLISRKWLTGIKAIIDPLIAKGRAGTGSLQELRSGQDAIVFSTNSLFETDNLWSELVYRMMDETKGEQNRRYLSLGNFAWWMLMNLGLETGLFTDMKKARIKVDMRLFADVPLNHWAAKLYRKVGVKPRIGGPETLESEIAFNVMGDFVIQAEIPAAASKRIHKLFQASASADQIDATTVARLAHDKYACSLKVFRNEHFARSLEQRYL